MLGWNTPFQSSTACAAEPQPGNEERVQVELVWPQTDISANQTHVPLAVIMTVQENWHIYPGVGSPDKVSEYLIQTEMQIELPIGWTTGPIQWPNAHDFVFDGESIKAYEGRALAYIPVTLPDSIEPGEYETSVTVRYQACDDQTCESPTSAVATGSIRITEAESESSIVEPIDELRTLFADFNPPASWQTTDTAPSDETVDKQPQRVKLSTALERSTLTPGDQIGLAVILDIVEHWHIYPGADSGFPSGYPTQLYLELPAGWTHSTIQWPTPIKFTFGPVGMTEQIDVYGDHAVAYVGITVPTTLKPGQYPFRVGVEYQACDDQMCEMPVTLWTAPTITIVSPDDVESIPDPPAETVKLFHDFDRAAAFSSDAPKEDGDGPVAANDEHEKEGLDIEVAYWWAIFVVVALSMVWMISRTFTMTGKNSYRIFVIILGLAGLLGSLSITRSMTRESELHWNPYTKAAFDEIRSMGDKTIVVEFTADWCLNCKTLEKTTLSNRKVVAALSEPSVVIYRVDLTGKNVEGEAFKDELGGGGIPLTAVFLPEVDEPVLLYGNYTPDPLLKALRGEALTANADEHVFDFLWLRFSLGSNAWPLILLLAGVAGFFMNLTPCVLPVIPIKILSLQAHAKDPTRCFILGLAFGLGIIALFAVLGVLIVGLISGINQLDWGGLWSFWWITGPVGLIIAVMGLGMLGMFTMQLPNVVYMFNPQSDSLTGSFLMGVFAGLLSTPCTGPLVGAMIAWALSQPAWLSFTSFIAMGIGMAFPYFLLTAKPSWLDKIPTSGAGSELVKQVMGLLLIAVAVFFLGNAAQALLA